MYEDTYDHMRYIPPWDDQDISGNSDVMNGLSRGDCGDPSLGSSRAVWSTLLENKKDVLPTSKVVRLVWNDSVEHNFLKSKL